MLEMPIVVARSEGKVVGYVLAIEVTRIVIGFDNRLSVAIRIDLFK